MGFGVFRLGGVEMPIAGEGLVRGDVVPPVG